jgi:hypothetical protein
MRAFVRVFFSFRSSKPVFISGLAIAAVGFLILATVSRSVGALVVIVGGLMVVGNSTKERR